MSNDTVVVSQAKSSCSGLWLCGFLFDIAWNGLWAPEKSAKDLQSLPLPINVCCVGAGTAPLTVDSSSSGLFALLHSFMRQTPSIVFAGLLWVCWIVHLCAAMFAKKHLRAATVSSGDPLAEENFVWAYWSQNSSGRGNIQYFGRQRLPVFEIWRPCKVVRHQCQSQTWLCLGPLFFCEELCSELKPWQSQASWPCFNSCKENHLQALCTLCMVLKAKHTHTHILHQALLTLAWVCRLLDRRVYLWVAYISTLFPILQ